MWPFLDRSLIAPMHLLDLLELKESPFSMEELNTEKLSQPIEQSIIPSEIDEYSFEKKEEYHLELFARGKCYQM